MPPTTQQPTPIGIRELAKTLKLSIGTVSRSLNNRYGVNAQTRAKVLAEAQRLGYVPNTAARQLKAHPAFEIGLLFHPFYGPHGEVNPYATNLIENLKRQAAAQGLGVDVIDFTTDDAIAQQFDALSVDVAVMLGWFPASTYERIHALGKPAINIHYQSGLPSQVSIVPDSRGAGETAAQYLAALGHERIALVSGPQQALHFSTFRKGFCEAMAEFSLQLPPQWLVELDERHSNAEGSQAVTETLLRGHDRPTAIVYASDWLAIGGVEAIRGAGLRVGADVSVTGYDNLPQAARLDPPLTSFDLNMPMAVRAIIRLTFELGAGRSPQGLDADNTLYLHASLVKRQSCVCIRRT